MKIGFAISDITPELGIYLTGYGMPKRLANSVHSPLSAIAMVIKDGDTEAAIIALDWCVIGADITKKFCQAVSQASGIMEQNILFSCTHTHSAPHTTDQRTIGRTTVDPENKGMEYAEKSIPAIVEAVCQAQRSMQETKVCIAGGKTEAGVSRRGLNKNGLIEGFHADPFAMYDSNMTAVKFKDVQNNQDIGVLIHCSAHNTAMGATPDISSDWCGVMRKRIGEYYQVPVIFINGAIGDVGPRTNKWLESTTMFGYSAGQGDGIKSVEEVGYRAASDALSLLMNMRDFRSDLPLKVHTSKLTLPQEIPMSAEEAKAIIEFHEAQSAPDKLFPREYYVAKQAFESWQQPLQETIEIPQTIVQIGSLALIPFPYEMFSVFSLRLRKYGPFKYNLLCSNVNGCYGYVPDKGAIAIGGYEVDCRQLMEKYVLKPEAGDLAVSQTLKALEEMTTHNSE